MEWLCNNASSSNYNMQQATINWDTLPQSVVRSELRAALNAGQIKLEGITESEFRSLINGEAVGGIQLKAAGLRAVGKAGCFSTAVDCDGVRFASVVVDRQPVETVAPTLVLESATVSAPAPVAPVAPVAAPAAPVAPVAAPVATTATDAGALEALRQILQPAAPALDINAVRQQAFEVSRETFPKLFADEIKNTPEAFDAAIAGVVKKFAGTELQATVSALFQTELGQSIISDVKAGAKVILPPIRPVSSYFRENKVSRAIEARVLSCFHVIISGPSGSGKTFPLEQVLNKLGRRWLKVSCADGLSMSELLAEKTIEVEDGAPVMKTVLKALPVCIREGIVLILDEADQLAGEILALFNASMDAHPAEVTIPQTGERIKAHRDFLVALTMNGLTDESGLYSGHSISGALKTRCRFVYADYLTKREEVSILKADGLGDTSAGEVVDVFARLRKAHTAGTLTMPPSTRTMLSVSKAMQGKNAYGVTVEALPMESLQDAITMTVLDALPPSERADIETVLNF